MDLDRIETLLGLLGKHPLVGEGELSGPGWKIQFRRRPPVFEDDFVDEVDEPETPPRFSILSDRVGFYRAPSPPLELGQQVVRGSRVGSIETMGFKNPLVAEGEGYLVEFLVDDGDPVEYGQPLITLQTDLPEPEAVE